MSLDPAKLQKPLRELRKLLNKLPKRPSPEQVHDLRTRSRRIEAMLQALRLNSRPNGRRLLQELRPVRKKAGKVRDMDVFTGFSAELRPDEQGKQSLIELVEYLGAKRYNQCRKLRRLVGQHRRPIRWHLKRLSSSIDKGFRTGQKQSNNGNEWPVDAATVALRLSNELARWPALNASQLHAYRLKVKQLLYVLQLSDEADQSLIKSLTEVKDAIGEWHDWQQLAGLAEKVLGRDSQQNLLKRIRATIQEKFEHALAVTNEMRRNLLEGSSSRRRGRAARKPAVTLNQPIVMAATSLAA